MNRGIFATPGREEEWTLSVQHTDEAVDRYVAVFEELARELRAARRAGLRVDSGSFRIARPASLGDPGGMSEHTVEGQAVRRLERSRDDRMLAGVCGGLARYFGIHPAFYRVGFVVLTLIGGAGILVYLAALLVIPDEGHDESIAAETLRQSRDRPWPLIGLGLLGLAGVVLLSRVTLWPRRRRRLDPAPARGRGDPVLRAAQLAAGSAGRRHR